jgi:hypothetical protein
MRLTLKKKKLKNLSLDTKVLLINQTNKIGGGHNNSGATIPWTTEIDKTNPWTTDGARTNTKGY